uniref:Uncharacterized protein n=1 Tax=Nothoprocta perdicaria TaxID=30464 RepID=A0A8C6ZRN0_NOTPE
MGREAGAWPRECCSQGSSLLPIYEKKPPWICTSSCSSRRGLILGPWSCLPSLRRGRLQSSIMERCSHRCGGTCPCARVRVCSAPRAGGESPAPGLLGAGDTWALPSSPGILRWIPHRSRPEAPATLTSTWAPEGCMAPRAAIQRRRVLPPVPKVPRHCDPCSARPAGHACIAREESGRDFHGKGVFCPH